MELVDPICDNCGKPCGWHMEDFGIGSYEYGNATGVDKNEHPVSNCCGVPISEEESDANSG